MALNIINVLKTSEVKSHMITKNLRISVYIMLVHLREVK